MSIKFSFIGGAIRSELYKRVCKSLRSGSKVSHEVIFAGFSPPNQKMPNNFKYIETDAPLTFSVEMAARHAVGEFLIIITDDILFSEEYINRLNYYVSKIGMEKVIVGARYKYLNKPSPNDKILTMDRNDPKAPITCIGQAFNREVWNKLGGICSRFTGVFHDMDMVMRFYEYGYTPFVMPDAYISEDRYLKIPHTLYKKTGKYSKKILDGLWIKDGQYSLKRALPVIPITDEYIKNNTKKIFTY